MGNYTLTMDLDEIPWYSKLELAEHQLERAIVLFLDEKDYISSITLAGASEEILGKLLNKNNLKHEMDDTVDSFAHGYGEGWEEHKKWLINQENYHRDNLKHLNPKQPKGGLDDEGAGEFIPIYPNAATRIIDRALGNYWKLTGKQTESMKRYYEVSNEAWAR